MERLRERQEPRPRLGLAQRLDLFRDRRLHASASARRSSALLVFLTVHAMFGTIHPTELVLLAS